LILQSEWNKYSLNRIFFYFNSEWNKCVSCFSRQGSRGRFSKYLLSFGALGPDFGIPGPDSGFPDPWFLAWGGGFPICGCSSVRAGKTFRRMGKMWPVKRKKKVYKIYSQILLFFSNWCFGEIITNTIHSCTLVERPGYGVC